MLGHSWSVKGTVKKSDRLLQNTIEQKCRTGDHRLILVEASVFDTSVKTMRQYILVSIFIKIKIDHHDHDIHFIIQIIIILIFK